MNDDLISRKAFYEELSNAGGCGAEKGSWDDGWDKAIGFAISLLAEAPAVAPDEKTVALSVPVVVNISEAQLEEVAAKVLSKNPDLGEAVGCIECKHRDDCTRQLTMIVRNHVLEINEYLHPVLDFCSYGERECDG